jgi:hypothetical protein
MHLSSGYESLDKLGFVLDKASMAMWKFMISAMPLERMAWSMLGVAGALGIFVGWAARGRTNFQELNIQFAELTGNVDEARRRVEMLYKFSETTPFTLEQVSKAGVILTQLSKRTGISFDQLTHAAGTLAAGTTGTGHDMQRAAQAMLAGVSGNMARLVRTFYFTKQEISSFANGAVDANGKILNSTKFAPAMIQAIYARYGNMLEELKGTIGQQWSNINDQILNSARLWGAVFEKWVQKVINLLSKLLKVLNAIAENPAMSGLVRFLVINGMYFALFTAIVSKAAAVVFNFAAFIILECSLARIVAFLGCRETSNKLHGRFCISSKTNNCP